MINSQGARSRSLVRLTIAILSSIPFTHYHHLETPVTLVLNVQEPGSTEEREVEESNIICRCLSH